MSRKAVGFRDRTVSLIKRISSRDLHAEARSKSPITNARLYPREPRAASGQLKNEAAESRLESITTTGRTNFLRRERSRLQRREREGPGRDRYRVLPRSGTTEK